MTVFQTFLVFDDLDSFEEYWSGILYPLNWDVSDAALMIRTGLMGLGEKDHRGKVPLSSHHTKGTYNQHDFSLLVFTLVTWLRQCVCQVSPLWNYFFPPLSMLYSWERTYLVQPTLKRWRVKLHLLEEAVSTQIIWSSPQEICLFFLICLSTCLVNMDSWIFILYFGDNPVLLYFVAQIVQLWPPRTLWVNFCDPLTYPHHCELCFLFEYFLVFWH